VSALRSWRRWICRGLNAERLAEQRIYTLDRHHFGLVRPRHAEASTLLL
jgi:hypothetical protein